MGYVVLHIEKAAGTDAAMSGHVERRIAPANVITTLTYLNEELVEFPKGVTNRTEAIQHRLDNAGLERKIGKNQVRALRVMLSGSPEDMKRIRQAAYQTTYAEAMAKYGLQRGIEGSEAKHISTQQYYREVFVRKNEIAKQVENLKEQRQTLTVDIAALQAQREAARSELTQTRREIKTDKLKGVAVDATTKAVERIGALFHDPKPARYEKQIADLQGVIADKDKCIGQLQQEIKTMQAGREKEVADLKQETRQVVKALMRVDNLCPYVKGLLKWENYCKNVGLDKEGTRALFTMQPYRYTGDLHSIRYNHTFWANDIVLQLKPDKDGPSGFRFTINGKDGDEWFRQQRKEFYERIGIDIERTEQRRGIKI